MIIGVGFNQCRDILAYPDNNVRQALVSQWALGYYSGLATAGAEADSTDYAELDAELHRLLATSADIRVTVNDWIITRCQADPEEHVAQVATDALLEFIDGGRK